MNPDSASRTAEIMALFRALESVRRTPPPRLFCDPFARYFLGLPLRTVVELARLRPVARALVTYIDRRWPGAITSGVARTRLIDDALTDALRDDVAQVVILGAGFDCRAYRLSGLSATRVFEVDHPATLAVKRARLARRLGVLPSHVTYVAVDFNRQEPCEALRAADFDVDARTFFLWEGVTNYLTDAAVDATLRGISGAARAGSSLLFTYVHRGLLDGSVAFHGTKRLFATLARVNESWTFGLDPETLAAYLAVRGLELVDDVGAADYRRRYMEHWVATGTGYEFYRAALARVR